MSSYSSGPARDDDAGHNNAGHNNAGHNSAGHDDADGSNAGGSNAGDDSARDDGYLADPDASGFERARYRFRYWRRTRPFWGGLLVVLGAAEILLSEKAPLPLVVHIGLQGLAGYLVPAVLLLCGILILFHPVQHTFYSILAVLLALGSWITSNLGGFFIGMLLGVVGGSLAFAWTRGLGRVEAPPPAPPPQPREPSSGIEIFRPSERGGRHRVRADDDTGPISLEPTLLQADDPSAEPGEAVGEPGEGVGEPGGAGQQGLSSGRQGSLTGQGELEAQEYRASAEPGASGERRTGQHGRAFGAGPLAVAILAAAQPVLLPGLLAPAPSSPGRGAAALPVPSRLAAFTTTASRSLSPSPRPILGVSPSPSPTPPPSGSPAPSDTPTPSATATPSSSPSQSLPGLAHGGGSVRPRRHVKRTSASGARAAATVSSISADSATMTGLVFDGVARVRTSTGRVKMLKFSMTTMTFAGGATLTYDIVAASLVTRAASLSFSGDIVLYTTRLAGDLHGAAVDYTPQHPPSALASDVTLTDVVTDQPYASAEALTGTGLELSES